MLQMAQQAVASRNSRNQEAAHHQHLSPHPMRFDAKKSALLIGCVEGDLAATAAHDASSQAIADVLYRVHDVLRSWQSKMMISWFATSASPSD